MFLLSLISLSRSSLFHILFWSFVHSFFLFLWFRLSCFRCFARSFADPFWVSLVLSFFVSVLKILRSAAPPFLERKKQGPLHPRTNSSEPVLVNNRSEKKPAVNARQCCCLRLCRILLRLCCGMIAALLSVVLTQNIKTNQTTFLIYQARTTAPTSSKGAYFRD